MRQNSGKIEFEKERRRLLKMLGATAISSVIFAERNFALNSIAPTEARASGRRPFVLSIHLGAMDGYSAGLMMPTDVAKYPKGVFFQNEVQNHPNPNVNAHHKTGNLIFNDYTKVLESISKDMMFCSATSQSASHEEAARIQSTGSKAVGGAMSPGWCAGLAQATLGNQAAAYVIADSSRAESAGSAARSTPSVSQVSANTLALLKAKFSHSDVMPSPASAADFAAASKALYNEQFNVSPATIATSRAASSAIDGLITGIPGFDTNRTNITASISRAKIDARLDAIPDRVAVKNVDTVGNVAANNNGMNAFLERLQMAALLIETQAASGMSISLGIAAFDTHTGGAAVRTARNAAQIWAQIAEFWTWVREKGYNNEVLVVVYNEFNRTAANATSLTFNAASPPAIPSSADVMIQGPGNTVVRAPTIVSPGNDHHLSCGIVFLNSKLPPASRLGAIGDTYIPTGTAGFDGVPSNTLPPYTSLQLYASVVMRVFPGVFRDYRALRDIWQPLKESDLISKLLT